jgi:hypothetical protein
MFLRFYSYRVRWLHEVPYYITLAVHDPIAVHGASHRRTRLLYALIRLACLAHPVPEQGFGSSQLPSPLFGCCACGFPLLWTGVCCRQRCASAQSSS